MFIIQHKDKQKKNPKNAKNASYPNSQVCLFSRTSAADFVGGMASKLMQDLLHRMMLAECWCS